MPLLRRQVLQKTSTAERLRDSDEVLFCQPTGEIFSNYEDYFHRIMLISSMVWSCAMTGRPNLTYTEALESEKAARKLLKTFPAAVKGPFLLIASHTQRTSINEMHEDVYGFVKDRLFKGEIVDAMDLTRKAFRPAVISNVLPDNTQGASTVMYQVTADDNMVPSVWNVTPSNVKRDRSTLTRDKCKLFLKQHVEAGPGGQLRIKADSLAKFVTGEGWTDDQVFLGQTPNFEQSKRLKQNAERSEVSGASKPPKKKATSTEKVTKMGPVDGEKQQQGEKSKKTKKQSTKMMEQKGKVKQKSSTGKQQSIAKYIETSTESAVLDAKAKKMAREVALQKLKQEQETLAKKRLEEEKALLLQQATLALKKYNAVLEDQELIDQRPMPAVRSVRPLIMSKHFGNFVFILEFLNSFSDMLAIRSKFSGGLTMHLLERALILREVNGPLSDIFKVLLSAIFTQQLEEENEVDVGYERVESLGLKRQTVPDQARARDTVLWCEKHYCTKLSEMPIDATTVSELLRLHFLSSGALVEEKAAKHRYYNRGGYSSADDPGLRLVRDYPHIFRALNSHSVYQLSIGDIIQILCCLIHQLLTYSGVRELVEERVERARTARYNYQTNRYAQRRLTVKTGSQKNQAREDMKRELAAFEGDIAAKEEHRKKLMELVKAQNNRIDAEAAREMKVLQTQSKRLKEDFFDYQIYLGSDRCFRKYWLFESLPGLFVEHDRTYAGRCLDRPTPNIPGLAFCAPDQRKKYITKAIMRCAGTDGVAGLLDAKAIAGENPNQDDSGGPVEEVYEQLLTLGSAEMERIGRQTTQTKTLNSRANSEEPRSDGTVNGGTVVHVPDSTPLPPPTNQELLMCTAQPDDCLVHTETHTQTVNWGYYATAEELDALIQSLNVRGAREKQLRETLECERDLILTHIEKCPVDKLSVNESDRAAVLSDICSRNQKRYDAPNFSCEPGTDPNEILEAVFLENLLELEAKITVGYLGVMRVRDRDKWRKALEAATYDPQTDKPLQWGPKRLAKPEETNGRERREQDVEQPQDEENDSDEHPNDNDSGCDSLERLLSDASNPGHSLPDTTVSLLDDTLATDEISFPVHVSEMLKQRVHAFARALLQVAQCIDQKFLRHPFGPKKEHKDKAVMMQKQYQGLKNLVQWEMSLMRSTCFAQLFLHYNVLYDAIHWSRSAERICCMICRRKGDPGLTLLCDECNRACHTYCLKPKLKEVPAGDWYCMRCRPENFKEKRAPAKKKKIFKWVEEEEEMSEDEESAEDDGTKQEEEEPEEEDQDEETEEIEQDEEQEPEEKQMEMDDAEEQSDVDEEEDSLSDASDSDDGGEDDGSDEEYRMRQRKQPAAKAKSNAKAKPAIVVTSTGRSSRSTAVTNGAYRYEEDEEGEDSNDDRDERRKRRKVTLPNGGATLRADTKRSAAVSGSTRAANLSSAKRKRAHTDEPEQSSPANTSKRLRRTALPNGGQKLNVSVATGSDDDSATKKTRVSARSTKGQRRMSVYLGDEEDDTPTRMRIGGSAARRSRRTGEDLPLNSVALYTLIDDILKHPSSWPFNRPVSAKEVPDYYAVIKNPMDFARIKSKLNMGDYKINEQMLSDVQLVFRNCDLYNTDETDVYRIGHELEQYVAKRCKELTLPFQPSDMQKSGLRHNAAPYKTVNGVAGAYEK
ncbi:bromodomain adjacent to zinc finger domain protein 1A [Anopheles moucheti]|uniref:bromodomain adjacent to zinc finger domain protein 1A n=1 Tax=Anopheles moucheti TaxID=186751 RepID=UPI0022F03D7B|nr:bromodomain adjacent to zinc finger domain protein 1A [Anopheles moucheti]XP_052900777.1 bromodomain adjacent to zinc finger domain protein 1A [Anopheles moucheti]